MHSAYAAPASGSPLAENRSHTHNPIQNPCVLSLLTNAAYMLVPKPATMPKPQCQNAGSRATSYTEPDQPKPFPTERKPSLLRLAAASLLDWCCSLQPATSTGTAYRSRACSWAISVEYLAKIASLRGLYDLVMVPSSTLRGSYAQAQPLMKALSSDSC